MSTPEPVIRTRVRPAPNVLAAPAAAPDDYRVGYGCPPLATRFETGKSGNPKGRPKGSRNLRTLLREALLKLIVVTEGGRRRKITKADALVTRLVNAALQGDMKAILAIFKLDGLPELVGAAAAAAGEPATPDAPALTDTDRDILDEMMAMARAAAERGDRQ